MIGAFTIYHCVTVLMTITKGIKGKVVSALRKPDIQYDYILPNSRRLSESLFELYSLAVTVPSPPLPSQGETNHILCSVFLLFLGMTVIVITSLFHLIGILRIIKPIIFFFLYRTWDDEVSSSKRHLFLHIRVSLQ